VCRIILSKKYPAIKQYNASKEVVALFATPVTAGNLVRIRCHLRRMSVDFFAVPHSVLTVAMKAATVSSVQLSAALIIRRGVFWTLWVTFSRFHIAVIRFGPVISAVINTHHQTISLYEYAWHPLHYISISYPQRPTNTRVGTLIVAIIYLQLIQNRYMFRRFTVLQCSHQHCVQPVASDVEVVGYL